MPEPGEDAFFFADLPWEEMGIGSNASIPQWLGYGPSRWTFATAPDNQMLLQGKLTDAGLTIVDLMANLIFEFAKMPVMIGNIVLLNTYQNIAASYMPGLISSCMKALYGSGLPDSNDAYPMWQFALGLAMVGLGISVAVNFFRAQLVRGLLNYALAALITAVLVGYFAHIEEITSWTNDLMDRGTALAVAGTFDALLDSGGSGIKTASFNDTLVRITEMTWDLFIGRPWALGQWGTCEYLTRDESSLRLSDDEITELEKNTYTEILGSVFKRSSSTESAAKTRLEIPDEARFIDKVYLGGNDVTRSKLLEIVQNRNSIVNNACGQEWVSAVRHVEYAILAVIPATIYGLLVISTGIPVFMAQVLFSVVLIFMPVVLIIGISGDGGRRVLIAYSRTALGLLLTKMVYGLYLSIILALVCLLGQAFSFSYAITIICTSVLMAYSWMRRKQVMQMTLCALTGSAPAAEGNIAALSWRQAMGIALAGRSPSGMRYQRNHLQDRPAESGDSHPEGKSLYPASEPPHRNECYVDVNESEQYKKDSERNADNNQIPVTREGCGGWMAARREREGET